MPDREVKDSEVSSSKHYISLIKSQFNFFCKCCFDLSLLSSDISTLPYLGIRFLYIMTSFCNSVTGYKHNFVFSAFTPIQTGRSVAD
jgi:hypothetical protein